MPLRPGFSRMEEMMRSPFLLTIAGTILAAASLAGAPADVLRTRIAGYHALGAAFKAANDTLRAEPANLQILRKSAAAIRKASREQYRWFPAGSGARPGAKTAAKAEIWAKPAEFRAAQDAFARQADVLARAAAGGDVAAIRLESRKLGAACKNCHDSFRESAD
jgi:cytochrome c556